MTLNDPEGHRRGAIYVAVVGPDDDAEADDIDAARRVGYELARHGAVLVCGGLGGVMQAACEGVRASNEENKGNGQAIGLLPGIDPHEGNKYLTVALPTGLGELRNGLVVRAADAIIAVGCSWGTLSEIALAMRMSKPTILIANHGWEIIYRHNQPQDKPLIVSSPEEAVGEAVKMARPSPERE
jgi:uncharacterized protein (TIGR00725 family)